VWFLDQENGLNALDLASGTHSLKAQLPSDALIQAMAATPTFVFALDSGAGILYVLDIERERLRNEPGPFSGGTALISDGGSQVWIASGATQELYSFEAHDRRLNVLEIGMKAELLALDALRGIWFSDGAQGLGFYDFRNGRLVELALGSDGSARSLLLDPSGTLWVGTVAGEVLSVRERTSELILRADRPITALALDPAGTVWYAAPSRNVPRRFVYAPAATGTAERALPGPAADLSFNSAGQAWLADPLGGFYLALESPK
jgi:hypothetical protein